MQRFAATLLAIILLAHGLVPALPTYLCTDGGRSLSPCSPQEKQEPEQTQAEWHVGDCCKLTAAATTDAPPPKLTRSEQHDRVLIAFLAPLLLLRFDEPLVALQSRLTRGDPTWRAPPPSRRTILRI